MAGCPLAPVKAMEEAEAEADEDGGDSKMGAWGGG